jgi:gliding motility-associated-like protein
LKLFINFFLTTLFAIPFVFPARAEHLAGGILSYDCIGPGTSPNTNRVQVFMKLFYDCNVDRSYETDVEIGIYRGSSTTYAFFRKYIARAITSPTNFSLNSSCAQLLNNLCVNAVTYTFIVEDLPILSENYLIAYQRCCRNMTITNIMDPGRTGSTIQMEITPDAQRACNSSPSFDATLPLVACANENLELDLRGNDKENDQITYELCAPLIGGGPRGMGTNAGTPTECTGITPNPSNCVPGFAEVRYTGMNITATSPFPSATPILISNGILTARPTLLGQYIFGICIKEYRNGLLYTVQRRDIQINFASCNITIKASIQAATLQNGFATVTNCTSDSVFRIQNTSIDSLYIKKIRWELDGPTGQKIIDSQFHFNRLLRDTGIYRGKLFLNKGNNCSDSLAIQVINSPRLPNVLARIEYDSCGDGNSRFLFTAGSGPYTVRFGDSSRDTIVAGATALQKKYVVPGSYTGSVRLINSFGCQSNQNFSIRVSPIPAQTLSLINSDTLLCFPGTFRPSLSNTLDTNFIYEWTTSDNRTFKSARPAIPIVQNSRFNLKLTVTSTSGCKISQSFSQEFITRNKPTASFTLSASQLSIKDPSVTIQNRSIGADTYTWSFGDSITSNLTNPSHVFKAAGRYIVRLIASNSMGCRDSTSQIVVVGIPEEVFAPNVFTPNGDNQNDEFLPKVITDFSEYALYIYDRWGNLLFYSQDPNIGWAGSNQAGKPAPIGVYVYQIKLSFADQATKVVAGSVTLLR